MNRQDRDRGAEMKLTERTRKLVGWLEFNVPFQHKYGYI